MPLSCNFQCRYRFLGTCFPAANDRTFLFIAMSHQETEENLMYTIAGLRRWRPMYFLDRGLRRELRCMYLGLPPATLLFPSDCHERSGAVAGMPLAGPLAYHFWRSLRRTPTPLFFPPRTVQDRQEICLIRTPCGCNLFVPYRKRVKYASKVYSNTTIAHRTR